MSVPRLWPGSTIVCIGGGPSLAVDDVNYCRGRARVIVINDAYKLAPWADCMYACDGKFWDLHKGAPSFAGLKYGMTVTKKWPDVTPLRNEGRDGLCLDPRGVCTGRNSGYQAINVAVHFGASRILLLGYDMKRDHGRSHWFEDRNGLIPSPYARFLEAFPSLVNPLAELDISVVNCSRRTALEVFPRMSIEEALPVQDMAVAS